MFKKKILLNYILLGILLAVFSPTSGFSSDFIGHFCIDIAGNPPKRIFQIAVSQVADNHYALQGIHKVNGVSAGSLTGSAYMWESAKPLITIVIHSAYSDLRRQTDGVTTYHFYLDPENHFSGSYRSTTQNITDQYRIQPLSYSVGRAVLVDCDQPLSTFPSRYINNGDRTVTDTGTGLIWQQASTSSVRDWQDGIDYCGELNLGGSTSWRLPSLVELESILDVTMRPRSIDPVFSSMQSDHWSATSDPTNSDLAWQINFGHAFPYKSTTEKTDYNVVRCVR